MTSALALKDFAEMPHYEHIADYACLRSNSYQIARLYRESAAETKRIHYNVVQQTTAYEDGQY